MNARISFPPDQVVRLRTALLLLRTHKVRGYKAAHTTFYDAVTRLGLAIRPAFLAGRGVTVTLTPAMMDAITAASQEVPR